MSVMTGGRFGPYEIVGPLGSGGMGVVYRARDPRLNRDVAIKVLAHADADPVRRRRFTDEAQAASALNHPNILTVYDVGTDDHGSPYIVSELVEGESLRARLTGAPLAIREVLDLGVQMADGLAAAHQAGIVHRDFKPENVMVTRDHRVKIVDFGLAQVDIRDGVLASEVVTLTASGVIVGTIPYMSPEQARGATVDYRTDQFSLGLMLYELVTGRRAFQAATMAQTLSAIIEDEPEPIAKVNGRVPAPLCWVIERCLAKETRHRYDTTADLARELHTLRDRVGEYAPSTELAVPPARRRRGLAIVALAGMVATATIGVIVGLASSGAHTAFDRYRFTPFATDAGYQGLPAWSPDGKTLAYIAERDGVLQIFTRSLGSPRRAQVTHSQFDCRDPFWSPDGTRLYYIAPARDRKGLWSITSVGGEPELVAQDVNQAALSPDGKTLAFFRPDGNDMVGGAGLQKLWLASPPASQPVQYNRLPFGEHSNYSDATLHFSPDGSKLGVWVSLWRDKADRVQPEFWVIPVGGAAPYTVPPPADLANYAAAFGWLADSRHIVSAIPYPGPGVHLWLTDTERQAHRLLTMTGSAENDPAVSPDGSRVALSIQQADYDLYQLSGEHPVPSPVLATSRSEMDPAWSPSGDLMAFTTDRTGHEEIWLRSQSGDWERPLVTRQDFAASETYLLHGAAFSPDGQRIAYYRLGPEGNRIWITPVANGPPVQLAAGEYVQDSPTWSPDGAWIAYAQGRHGEWALAKTRLGTSGPSELVARDIIPFSRVQWSPNNAWLAYNGLGGLSLVTPDGRSTRVVQDQPWLTFAWSQDSRRLYGIRQSDDFRHLTFTSVDIESKAERVLSADFMPLPVSGQPVRGFARVSATTFVTSIAHVRSDIWLLEKFDAPSDLRDRFGAFFSRHR